MMKRMLGIMLAVCMVFVLGVPQKAKAADAPTQKALQVNQTYTEVWQEGETKLYSFTVPQAGNIDIEIKNTNPVGGHKVEASLFDSNNAQVLDRVDGANLILPTYSSDAGKTYYLKVSDDYDAWETSFTVRINFQATSNWETENNDTTPTADTITANKVYNGIINSDYDKCDYYKFYIPGNRKVSIKFGPAMVDGERREWDVYLLNSKNESVHVFETSTTQTYSAYLKKGTYYIKVENNYNAREVQYAFSYSTKTLKIKQPKIKSITGTAYRGWLGPNYVKIKKIKIKNSGDCQGYQVRVAKKKSMKGSLANEAIAFGNGNSKGKVALSTNMGVFKKYYVKLRGYVNDPFGKKIYGKYSKVKCKTTKKKVYKQYKN